MSNLREQNYISTNFTGRYLQLTVDQTQIIRTKLRVFQPSFYNVYDQGSQTLFLKILKLMTHPCKTQVIGEWSILAFGNPIYDAQNNFKLVTVCDNFLYSMISRFLGSSLSYLYRFRGLLSVYFSVLLMALHSVIE